MSNSFYQTIPQSPKETAASEKNARNQEGVLYEYMREQGGSWSAWDLKDRFKEMEITSIRRALWVLENKRKKIKQSGWVNGPKGKPVGMFTVIWMTQGKQASIF
jgi:hypothetical protein